MTAPVRHRRSAMEIWQCVKPDALLHHSGHGSKHTSEQFQRLMADNDVLLDELVWQCVGQCGDGELLLLAKDLTDSVQMYRTRDEARTDVFDYVEAPLQSEAEAFKNFSSQVEN